MHDDGDVMLLLNENVKERELLAFFVVSTRFYGSRVNEFVEYTMYA